LKFEQGWLELYLLLADIPRKMLALHAPMQGLVLVEKILMQPLEVGRHQKMGHLNDVSVDSSEKKALLQ
jgi:hypothetical protein